MQLPAPRWVGQEWMGPVPQITRYAGPTSKAIVWFSRESRVRYQIDVGEQSIDLNVAQARAIAQMLLADPVLRTDEVA